MSKLSYIKQQMMHERQCFMILMSLVAIMINDHTMAVLNQVSISNGSFTVNAFIHNARTLTVVL